LVLLLPPQFVEAQQLATQRVVNAIQRTASSYLTIRVSDGTAFVSPATSGKQDTMIGHVDNFESLVSAGNTLIAAGNAFLGAIDAAMGTVVSNGNTANGHLEAMADDIESIRNSPGTETTHGNDVVGKGTPVHFEAASTLSGRTPVINGKVIRPLTDLLGRILVGGMCDRDSQVGGVTTITDGASTQATDLTAAGALTFIEVTDIIIDNTSATAVEVDIRSGVAGTIVANFPAPANISGVAHSFRTPPPIAANTGVFIDPSAAVTSLKVTMYGCVVK
jgi:hypothetical protein